MYGKPRNRIHRPPESWWFGEDRWWKSPRWWAGAMPQGYSVFLACVQCLTQFLAPQKGEESHGKRNCRQVPQLWPTPAHPVVLTTLVLGVPALSGSSALADRLLLLLVVFLLAHSFSPAAGTLPQQLHTWAFTATRLPPLLKAQIIKIKKGSKCPFPIPQLLSTFDHIVTTLPDFLLVFNLFPLLYLRLLTMFLLLMFSSLISHQEYPNILSILSWPFSRSYFLEFPFSVQQLKWYFSPSSLSSIFAPSISLPPSPHMSFSSDFRPFTFDF